MWFADTGVHDPGAIGRITTGRSITPSPRQGQAGDAFTLTGNGFTPNEVVDVTIADGATSLPLCSATTGSLGRFTCVANVPSSSLAMHTITAKGETSGHKARTVFLVHS
jgi:hypothetical protein